MMVGYCERMEQLCIKHAGPTLFWGCLRLVVSVGNVELRFNLKLVDHDRLIEENLPDYELELEDKS